MKKPKEIIVVVKTPGEKAKMDTISNSLEGMQKVVGGNIEYVPWGNFDLYCNEEGKLNGLEPNLYNAVPGDVVVGTVFVSKANEDGEAVSLSKEEVSKIIDRLS